MGGWIWFESDYMNNEKQLISCTKMISAYDNIRSALVAWIGNNNMSQ